MANQTNIAQTTQPPVRSRAVGALIFAATLAVAFAAFAWLIVDTGRQLTDWILIVPAAVLGVVALAVAAAQDFATGAAATPAAQASGNAGRQKETRMALSLLVLLIVYAGSIAWIGFDIATALFLCIALIIQGERFSKAVIVGVVGAVLIVVIFLKLLLVQMPTLLM